MTLAQVHETCMAVLRKYGCDEPNALAIADNITGAERDHATSHGTVSIYINCCLRRRYNDKAQQQTNPLLFHCLQPSLRWKTRAVLAQESYVFGLH